MRFWDSLAILPLLVKESTTPFVTLDKNLAASAGKEGFSLVSIKTTN
jgi:hypothetical protein